MKLLITIFFFIISCCLSYASPKTDSVKVIATEIAKQNVYESAIVGFAATPSTQIAKMNRLIKIASNRELYALAKHENAVVRLYALRAILIRGLSVSPELRSQFFNDNSIVVTLNGCIGDKVTVASVSRMILPKSS